LKTKANKHKLTFIVGLPASGKTTYMNKIKKDEICFDDITDIAKLQECIKTNDCIVTDPHLCVATRRDKAQLLFADIAEITWIFFENNKHQCLINAKNNPEKLISNLIEYYSKIYSPPNNYTLLPVYESNISLYNESQLEA
jgi:ABC-type phosphate transport system ATPase subunit